MAVLDANGQPLPDDYELQLAQQQAQAQLAAQRAAQTHETPLPPAPGPAPNTLRAAVTPPAPSANPINQQADQLSQLDTSPAPAPPPALTPEAQAEEAKLLGGTPAAAKPPAPAAPRGPSAERKAIDELKAAGAEQQTAAGAQGEAEVQANKANADAKDKAAGEQRQAVTDRLAYEQKLDAGRSDFQRRAEAAEEAARDYKFTDYFPTRTTGQKFLILLGTVLAGRTPGDAIDKAIDGHFKRQQEQSTSLKEFAAAKRQGVKDYDQWASQQRAQFDIRAAMAKDATATELEAQALRSQDPVIRARAQAEAAKLRQSAADKLVKAEGDYATNQADREYKRAAAANQRAEAGARRATAGGKPTEAQNKLAGFAAEGARALDVLDRTGAPSDQALDQYNQNKRLLSATNQPKGLLQAAGGELGRAVGAIPRGPYEGIKARDQLALNAYEKLQEMEGRMHSGGAISEDEHRTFQNLITPSPGDSPALRREKLESAKQLVRNSLSLSGPAGGLVTAGAPSIAAAGGPAEGATATNPQTGEKIVYRGGQWQRQ